MPLVTIFSRLQGMKPAASIMLASVLMIALPSCNRGTTQKDPPIPPKPGGHTLPPLPSIPSTIQNGEKVDVYVIEDDSFNGNYKVSSSGNIVLPRIGRVKIGGLTQPGAESAVKRALEVDQLRKAKVIIERPDPLTIEDASPEYTVEAFLSGKVARPGKYRLVGVSNNPPSVFQAVQQAGGCARFAHKKKAHILRRSADGRFIRIEADLIAIEKGEIPDIPLAPGDTVVVPEKKFDPGI